MTAVRSSLLVHWTGKSITLDRASIDDEQRAQFIDLLCSILRDGLRLSDCLEVSRYVEHGSNIHHGHARKARIACFTEVRLSDAATHAKRYGLLGIGVSRQWVLDRYGGPVLYTRGRDDDMLTEHLGALGAWLTKLGNEYRGRDEEKHAQIEDHFRRVVNILCFAKPMSAPRGDEDFSILDEQEWRIVRVPRLEQSPVVRNDGNVLALVLNPEDLRLVVFPDSKTQALANERMELRPFIERPTPPVMLTLADAENL